jgi:hypothetical protein
VAVLTGSGPCSWNDFVAFEVLSCVPQESGLGTVIFSVFINHSRGAINYSRDLRFADDIQIYRAIKSLED